jgi:AcrR family transcriptional regulator
MPRAGLTTQRVIAEAATVADEVGLDRLTLAAVAQRCGVSLPGLYKHVSGLEEVKRGISITAIRELTASAAAAAAGVSGREALAAISVAYRQYARSAPGRYAASVRAPTPGDQEYADVTNQAMAVLSAAFKGYHLDDADLIHAIRMWRAACHGLASLEMAGGFGLPESIDVTFERLIDALDRAFRASLLDDLDGAAGARRGRDALVSGDTRW